MGGPGRRGFGLVDAAVVVAVVAVLAAVLVVTGGRSRGHAYQAGSVANLHEFAAVTASYGADYQDMVWALTWRMGDEGLSQFEDINSQLRSAYQFDAVALQAVDIARRRGEPGMPTGINWAAPVLSGHWVLSDYLDRPLSLPFAVSPGDTMRRKWTEDVERFRTSGFAPNQPDPDGIGMRHAYSTSYRIGPAWWSPDYGTATRSTATSGTSFNTFRLTTSSNQRVDWGGRRMTEVAYPSHKVFMFDEAQWSGARSAVFWAFEHARPPMLLADGSTHVRATNQANNGFNPGMPLNIFPMVAEYFAWPWEPPGSGILQFNYYFTRSGLLGRDFDGLDVPVTP